MTEKKHSSCIEGDALKQILEAALLAAGQALTHAQLAALFTEDEQPSNKAISQALEQLQLECENRGIELIEVASGYRLQVKQSLHDWVSRLWTERPQRYSRALLETMSLIAYRQPITRGEIEAVRGVAVSTNIIRTLQEREWIRVVGHRDVPGKPALFGTTREFLDYFNLKNLDDLPTLAEIRDMENLEPELDLEPEHEDKPLPAIPDNELDESLNESSGEDQDQDEGSDSENSYDEEENQDNSIQVNQDETAEKP
jgi:segregation and condensation protein B